VAVKDTARAYRSLRHYIIVLLFLAAALPLGIIGGSIYHEFRKSVEANVTRRLVVMVTRHKTSIETFLKETIAAMRMVTHIESPEELTRDGGLQAVFEMLQHEYNQAFEDLGVIDSNGEHLAYVGPYNLLGRNYREAPWFHEVMQKRVFISDVFLGFRNVPHFIIAVKEGEGSESWILRATINTAFFRYLVENVQIGRTGEAFIVNREGYYQTQPRISGRIMQKNMELDLELDPFDGVKFDKVTVDGGQEILSARTWLGQPSWLLVVQQHVDDAYGDLRATRNMAIVLFVIGIAVITVVTVVTTRLLVRRIEQADTEKHLLDEQLIQSQKLASIGTLSAGIAHEINNPLAIIGEEAGWMQDLLKRESLKGIQEMADFEDSLREIALQAGRCKEITHKLLSFARKMESVVKDVDLNTLIEEVIGLVEREANLSDIRIVREFASDLPRIYSDPSLIRQVILNLLTNATYAIGKGGAITIATQPLDDDRISIRVQDTGQGIPEASLSKIFDPFFTTKPAGKGTGLGLSICHGIIQKLGGDITVASKVGKGATFTIHLPLGPAEA